MRLRNKHDNDKEWDKINNSYPSVDDIIKSRRREVEIKYMKKRKEYLESEIHSNHNDGYVKEGLTKELKTLMESLNSIDDIDNETYGSSFGMGY